jgi:hypothetical protein
VPLLETLPPLTPASADAGAGNWRMIVLTGPTQIAVPGPAPVVSDAYLAELAAIKTAQASLTDTQRASIEYWSGGGVLRWNQIMRELVARADLPPAPRDDGTYPVPDSENPFADPQFPFVPAYPSEDAVVSGVSVELLKLLFPTSVEEITRKAAEQRDAALLSGRASRGRAWSRRLARRCCPPSDR